jgi:hypothetical protein
MGTHDYKILYQYKDKNDVHGFTMQIGLVIARKGSLLQVIYLSLEGAQWHGVRKNSQLLHSIQLMLNIKQYHIRTKHIKMHYHYIREKVLHGKIELTYVIISDQIANILTKSLGQIKFQIFKNKWECKVFVDVKQND